MLESRPGRRRIHRGHTPPPRAAMLRRQKTTKALRGVTAFAARPAAGDSGNDRLRRIVMRRHILAAVFTIALDTTSAWPVGRTWGDVEEPDAAASIHRNSFGASVSDMRGVLLVAESRSEEHTSELQSLRHLV